MIERCLRCGLYWSHMCGDRSRFAVITRVCPDCVPQLYPVVR